MTVDEIRTEFMMGRLSRHDAVEALTVAHEPASALGYIHIEPSPLLRLHGALRAAGHDVTRIDRRVR